MQIAVLVDGEKLVQVTLTDVDLKALSKPDHPLWKKATALLATQLQELERVK